MSYEFSWLNLPKWDLGEKGSLVEPENIDMFGMNRLLAGDIGK